MARQRKIIWYVLPQYSLIIILTLGIATWYGFVAARKLYVDRTHGELEKRAMFVAHLITDDLARADYGAVNDLCRKVGGATGTRITVITPRGVVVGDSVAVVSMMDNHADRPEIQKALTGNIGKRSRFSFTLNRDLIYVAVPIRRAGSIIGIVRASVTADSIADVLDTFFIKILVAGLIIASAAVLIGIAFAQRLHRAVNGIRDGVARLARGDLSARICASDITELASLSGDVNVMAAKLKERMDTIMRQQNELEAVLGGMADVLIAVDGDGHVSMFNRSAERLLHMRTCDVVGRSADEVLGMPVLVDFLYRVRSSDAPCEADLDLTMDRNLIMRAHGTRIRDMRGRTTAAIIVMHDVTALMKIDRMRRDFVANVSHELRTPLTSLKAALETMEGAAADDPQASKRFWNMIGANVIRLDRLVEDILALASLEHAQYDGDISAKPERLDDIVAAAAASCDQRARARGVRLDVRSAEGLLDADAGILERAVANLVDNAIKHSKNGSTVCIEAFFESDTAVIRVSDQGEGISTEHLLRIFERFYRVPSARGTDGTGLGLAIVKHAAMLHHGDVSAESVCGKGSVFTIRIPTSHNMVRPHF